MEGNSFAKLLLLHLIKRQAEGRTTRFPKRSLCESWDASIANAVDLLRES
ncbi:MAG: hypothetical protein HC916_19050 [Coleofasciculaceae cyanobacterium SM2_1_6]|nr:hypothetical protein [Coleofasciculaceae cyanobacterium SM2_1_6]